MKRLFLKSNQFSDTSCCFLGPDFIGNGHWLINRSCVSNRKKFISTELTKKFLKDNPEIHTKEGTLLDRVKESEALEPFSEITLSDMCMGKGVLLISNGRLKSIQAPHANMLKQLLGKGDKIMGNKHMLAAYNENGEVGLIITMYNMGDLINSKRNRAIIKQLNREISMENDDI